MLSQNLNVHAMDQTLKSESVNTQNRAVTHAQRPSSPGSVDAALISGSRAAVLLNTISVRVLLLPSLHLFHSGVIFSESTLMFGSRDTTTSRKDPEKAAMKARLFHGVPYLNLQK